MGTPRQTVYRQPIVARELDLHELGVKEALNEFRRVYKQVLNSAPWTHIKVIHGYGSSGEGGKIIWKLRELLAYNREQARLRFECGEDLDPRSSPQRYLSLGYTIVSPIKPLLELPGTKAQRSEGLPGAVGGPLERAIMRYCKQPRQKAQLMNKYRHYGEASVRGMILRLLREGRLKLVGSRADELVVSS